MSGAQNHVGMDGVALDLVRQADGGRFGHGRVADQGALDLGRAQPVAGHFDHVVHPADDPEIAVLIFAGAVAGEIHARETAPVLADVALGILVDRAQHGRPGLLEHQVAFFAGGDRACHFHHRRRLPRRGRGGWRCRVSSSVTGMGVIINMPVSVCHQVSMIGQRPLPITS